MKLPWITALAFAPRIKNCIALGPAPHWTESLTHLGASVDAGLVLLTKSTALSKTCSGTGSFQLIVDIPLAFLQLTLWLMLVGLQEWSFWQWKVRHHDSDNLT